MTSRAPRFPTVLAAVTLTLALAATGCGGDDDSAAEAAPSISKADFIEQGNQICTEGNAELAELGESIDPTDPAALEAAVTETFVPNIQGQLDDLRALGFPEGDEDTLETIYSDAEDELAQLGDDPSALLSGEFFADTNAALTDYGLTTCGSS